MVFSAKFNVTNLNGKNGFAFIDDATERGFGSILDLNDINNDDRSDLLVITDSNQAYVLFGADNFPEKIYTSNIDGTNGFIIIGDDASVSIGCAAAGVKDINSDGINDFIISVCDDAVYSLSFVIFGACSFPPRVSLANLDGTNGFRIVGYTGHNFLYSAGIGDINEDGISDFIISDYCWYSPSTNGVVYTIYGTNHFPMLFNISNLNGNNGFTIIETASDNRVEPFVAGVGDVNGDTKPDFVIGMWPYRKAFVFFGGHQFSTITYASTLNGTNGFALIGPSFFGAPIAGVGDVNGDNLSDLAVGCFDEANNVFVIFGAKSFSAIFDVSHLNGTNGVKLDGYMDSHFGDSVSGISSLNKNDKSGIVIGAPQINKTAGAAYVVFGSDQFSSIFNVTQLNGYNGFEIVGKPDSGLGMSVASLNNFTGNEEPTIVVGALFDSTVYVILGGRIAS